MACVSFCLLLLIRDLLENRVDDSVPDAVERSPSKHHVVWREDIQRHTQPKFVKYEAFESIVEPKADCCSVRLEQIARTRHRLAGLLVGCSYDFDGDSEIAEARIDSRMDMNDERLALRVSKVKICVPRVPDESVARDRVCDRLGFVAVRDRDRNGGGLIHHLC